MYNPLTNDEEEIISSKSTSSSSSHQKGSGSKRGSGKKGAYSVKKEMSTTTGEKEVYDPETLKLQKNVYTLFEGKIHLRADTPMLPLEVTCFVETQESVIKDTPVFGFGEIIKQSGESEMMETKEFLIKSY